MKVNISYLANVIFYTLLLGITYKLMGIEMLVILGFVLVIAGINVEVELKEQQ